jgi:hypothetical protein
LFTHNLFEQNTKSTKKPHELSVNATQTMAMKRSSTMAKLQEGIIKSGTGVTDFKTKLSDYRATSESLKHVSKHNRSSIPSQITQSLVLEESKTHFTPAGEKSVDVRSSYFGNILSGIWLRPSNTSVVDEKALPDLQISYESPKNRFKKPLSQHRFKCLCEPSSEPFACNSAFLWLTLVNPRFDFNKSRRMYLDLLGV